MLYNAFFFLLFLKNDLLLLLIVLNEILSLILHHLCFVTKSGLDVIRGCVRILTKCHGGRTMTEQMEFWIYDDI